MSQIHVIPQNDLHDHDTSPECACEPRHEFADVDSGELFPNGASLVIHNAYDGREAAEDLLGDGLGEHKAWGLFWEDGTVVDE